MLNAEQRAHDIAAGPELEVPAYGCEDHFQELDTAEHSWECIAELLRGNHTHDILCDIGMPVIHRGIRCSSHEQSSLACFHLT